MRQKITSELLRDLKSQGYTALIAPGQLEADEALFTPSKEPVESIIDCASCRPFEEDDIILLTDDVIDYIPEDYFEGKQVEI